ncbi:hypothetical protein NMG60_11014341 [Bertholletia excelsa]
MESLSIGLSSSPALQNHPKSLKPTSKLIPFIPTSISTSNSRNCDRTHFVEVRQIQPLIHRLYATIHPKLLHLNFPNISLKTHLYLLSVGLTFPLGSFASETAAQAEEASNKINLEAILVSIDDFFNRNPFFVAGVTFIWLVVIPLTQEFLEKYKFISAIDAFRKLRDDPNSQLLDIRDRKSLQYLGSPNLKIVNKGVVQVEFLNGDEEGFVKKVLEEFTEPANTVLCILDNFDGNSMKVAELLYKNGFKEAYAIRGGVRGKKGWQEIQESLLPPSVHIYPRKKAKTPQPLETNGGMNHPCNQASSSTTLSTTESKNADNGHVHKGITVKDISGSRPLSPYPNYPDLKPLLHQLHQSLKIMPRAIQEVDLPVRVENVPPLVPSLPLPHFFFAMRQYKRQLCRV